MKIVEKILKALAIAAGWLIGLLLIFGTALQPIIYYQCLAVALAVIAGYFFFYIEVGRKTDAED